MHRANSLIQLAQLSNHRNTDLRSRNHVNVHASSRQRLKESERNTRVGLHTRANQRQLTNRLVVDNLLEAQLSLSILQSLQRGRALRLIQSEGNIGHARAVSGNVLNNHVQVHLRLIQQAEHLRCRTGNIRNTNNGNLCAGAIVRNTRNQGLFQGNLLQMGGGQFRGLLRDHNGAFKVRERRTHVKLQIKTTSILDTAQVQNLRTVRRHLQHFLTGDGIQLMRGRHDARVGGEHAVHVRVNLAHISVQGSRQRNSGRIGTAAAQSGNVAALTVHALEARNNRNVASLNRLTDTVRVDLHQARRTVHAVGNHASLRTSERLSLSAQVVNSHRQDGSRNAFTGSQQHVQLTGRSDIAGDFCGKVEQLIGGVTHSGHHDDHIVTCLLSVHDAAGNALDALRIRYGGTAELLDDQAHRYLQVSYFVCYRQTPAPHL
ncbi:integrase [Rothia mucilaginosa DY-18]|uniref:Integrase n=1 Tax=Rothia mucilaginosa (strain DY-18) TaxID=680646 RepID=D2NPN7_ROTMD|nr:integrase [Rothia mucilaginosa DY-18]